MPLQPPGNRIFRTYYDGNGKLQSQYIGAAPITCATCGRATYRTASGRCPWGPLCRRQERDHG